MGAYRPLLGAEVEHEFYRGERCAGLSLLPIGNTAQFLARAGLLLRPRSMSCGVELAYDDAQRDALASLIDESPVQRPPDAPVLVQDTDAPANVASEPAEVVAEDERRGLELAFKLVVRDPEVEVVSAEGLFREGTILHFDSANAVADGGRMRLHTGESASADDSIALTAKRLERLLTRHERVAPPMATLSIRLGEEGGGKAFVASLENGPARYFARCGARRTFWKYYLLGDFSEREVEIVDLDEQVEFEPLAGLVALAGGAAAQAFRSTSAIALRERSERRFQLRERSKPRRTLMARLPVAHGSAIARDDSRLVSEIYING